MVWGFFFFWGGGGLEVPDFAVARWDEHHRVALEGVDILGYSDQGFGTITLCQHVAYPTTWHDPCQHQQKGQNLVAISISTRFNCLSHIFVGAISSEVFRCITTNLFHIGKVIYSISKRLFELWSANYQQSMHPSIFKIQLTSFYLQC